MQRPLTPALAPGTAIRTLCPNCCGAGRIASDRAAHSDNLGITGGIQMHPCPTCHGHRWLAGLQSPV